MFWDHLVLNSLYRKYSLGPFSFKFSLQGNMFWDHLVLYFKMLSSANNIYVKTKIKWDLVIIG